MNPSGSDAGAQKAAAACPEAMSRAQCAAFAKASAKRTPSYTVTSPRDCLKVMTRAQCKERLSEEIAAQAQAGPSFRPEDCLKFYTRAQCRALAAQYKAQLAASQ